MQCYCGAGEDHLPFLYGIFYQGKISVIMKDTGCFLA